MSALTKWFERVKSGGNAMERAKKHAMATGHGIRQGGESLLIGGMLGALHVEKGLDHKKVPIDAAAGAILLVGGVALAHEEIGTDLRNAGSAALAVFGFRKAYDVLAEKKRSAGQVPAGQFHGEPGYNQFGTESSHADVGEDPILTAAKAL